jgi:hypothetical protein
LCSPGWPQTLDLASTSQVLELQFNENQAWWYKSVFNIKHNLVMMYYIFFKNLIHWWSQITDIWVKFFSDNSSSCFLISFVDFFLRSVVFMYLLIFKYGVFLVILL